MEFGHQGVVLVPDRVQCSLSNIADGSGICCPRPRKQSCHDARIPVAEVGE
jgi:hypothetical protein